jgi:hypothetical protein
MKIHPHFAPSTCIHRSFFLLFLLGIEALKRFFTSLNVLRFSTVWGVEENTNNFLQNFQTLRGKQYVYRIHAKAEKIKRVSKEIRGCQLAGLKASAHSRLSSKRGSNVARLDEYKAEERDKRNKIERKGKTRKRFLVIHCCLRAMLTSIIFFSLTSQIQACSGRFVNPLTDICWSCLFPISIGAINVSGGGREDIPNPPQIPCWCPRPPIPGLVPGVPVGFWEPVRGPLVCLSGHLLA